MGEETLVPLVPNNSSSLRINPGEEAEPRDHEPVKIIVTEEAGDAPEFDDKGAIVRIRHADGDITISLDGRPIQQARKKPHKWFDNLVEEIDEDELNRISDELMRGISDDLMSREEWIQERAQGIRLLGLKIELPDTSQPVDGAPVEGMSRVRHPLLQEAVLRFQANARSELLPTDGPVKVRVDNTAGSNMDDALGNALEMDMNHYLTAVAKEYYPDTDRMLLMLGFGGSCFKKVYYHPIKQRPVSESVDADDLIVNNSATDLADAKRVTHRSYLRPSVVRRMQIIGEYRDIDLPAPREPELDATQREKKQQEGVRATAMRPDERDREIYECYCELDIKGYEHKLNGEETGLEIPYRVTIDKSSEKILSIVRDYDEDTKDLPEKRTTFVKYAFVPGFGFYDLGLVHILGNTTNALTAVWRELLDAGMFACFPGFLISKAGSRQQTNIFRVPPGGGVQIDTAGQPINQAVMPLPYKEPSQALMALAEEMMQTGQRVGGTAELQVGEGKSDAPVGTTITMVEQATKMMNSVHKRMHAAQADEFELLVRCFREHPDAFLRMKKNPSNRKWEEEEFVAALNDRDLEPQADPNTASFGQRVLKYYGLLQLADKYPMLYNLIEINKSIITEVLKIGNPEQFLAPPSAMGKPTPDQELDKAKAQADTTKSQAAMITAQARMIDAKNGKSDGFGGAMDAPITPAEQEAKLMDAKTKAMKVAVDHQNNLLDARDKAAQLVQDREDNRAALAMEARKHQDEMRLEQMKLHADAQQEQQKMQFEQQRAHTDAQMQMQQHREGLGAEQQRGEQEMQQRAHEHETGRQDAKEDREAQLKHEEREGAQSRKHEAQQAKAKAATAKAKPKAKE